MNYRTLGKTGLKVSEIGFGAWGIGGPAMAGDVPIGWGNINDDESKKALVKAFDLGINFFDTADFYGLGHSEELIGEVFSDKRDEIIIATKIGLRLSNDNSIVTDYSPHYIHFACEKSLKRLQTDYIDLYQLHNARMDHLECGDCIDEMEKLQREGKIRYWGISLNTFEPEPEAEFFIQNKLGYTFQIVLNIINQIGLEKVIPEAEKAHYGIIARMPLQFGLLTGKFNKESKFEKADHRNFRLTPEILSESLDKLEPVWEVIDKYKIDKTSFALSFVLNHPEISTAIPGIKSVQQAVSNTKVLAKIKDEDLELLHEFYKTDFKNLLKEYV